MENISVQECPYCSTVLPIRGYFCPSCRKQTRCRTCNELVEKGALGCVMCGAEITISVPIDNSYTVNDSQGARNKIHFERKGKSVILDADITDVSSAYFADTIGSIVTNGNFQFRGRQNKPLLFQKEIQSGSIIIPTTTSTKANQANEYNFDDANDDAHEILKKIFTVENDELKLVDPRLKQSGKLDHAVRLTLLVLYTYEVLGKPQVERLTLTNILRQSKLDDGHSRDWIAKSNELILKDDNVELSVPGREVAKSILAELADSSIDVGKVSYSKPKAGKNSRKKKDVQKNQSTSLADNKNSSSKPSPMVMLQMLVGDGFFKERRKIKDIIEYCSVNKAQHYKNNDLSGPLGRSIKDGTLKREKSKSDNQYEYYT